LKNGLILTPSDDFKIDCYPDANFAGLWQRNDKQDPYCVRSRTGYVTCFADCPILWKSKLQTEIALSTMEAVYVPSALLAVTSSLSLILQKRSAPNSIQTNVTSTKTQSSISKSKKIMLVLWPLVSWNLNE
jgi:hypothetical protein